MSDFVKFLWSLIDLAMPLLAIFFIAMSVVGNVLDWPFEDRADALLHAILFLVISNRIGQGR